MNFILIGPQGSGKGTQAELLSRKLRLPIIDLGKIYRQEIKKKTKLGLMAGNFVVKGFLVPEELTEALLKKELKKSKFKKGLIFDGFPRNIKQLKFLLKQINIDYVIQINISQRESVKRLSARRVCENCGQIYNLLAKRPQKDLACDRCGHKLNQRADDYPAAIKKRLKIYNQQTLPLLKYFKKEHRLIKIDGNGLIKVVFKRLLKVLNTKGIK